MDNKVLELGTLIRKKRKTMGYSTSKLSSLANVSVGLINYIEHGKTDAFNIDLLAKLLDILQINPEEYMKILLNNIQFKKLDLKDLNDTDEYISEFQTEITALFSSKIIPFDKKKLFLLKLLNEIDYFEKIYKS